jgi:hypothetical protein
MTAHVLNLNSVELQVFEPTRRSERLDRQRLHVRHCLNAAPGCLSPSGGNTTNGTAVILSNCNGSPGQKWAISRRARG